MMHAAVVDLLTGSGKFSTEQSLVLAEAMDMTIDKAQLVTVPILDARFAVHGGRLDRVEARIDALVARIDALEAKIDAKLERWAIRLVIAMLLSQAALGPIGVGALETVRRVLSAVVH